MEIIKFWIDSRPETNRRRDTVSTTQSTLHARIIAEEGQTLIGWRTVTVTTDMVGKPIAQFLSIEVKTPTGRVRPDQTNWLEQVNLHGGHAIIARSVSDTDNL